MYSYKKRSKKRYAVVAGLILLIAIVGTGLVAQNWYYANIKPVSSSSETVKLTIPNGSSSSQVADIFAEAGVIKNKRAFELYLKLSGLGPKLKAGTYELSGSMSVKELVAVVVEGVEASSLYTIGPGQRVGQIKSKMIGAGFDAADVETALKADTYKDHELYKYFKDSNSLEGFVFPETLRITDNSTPKDIITASLDQLAVVLSGDIIQAIEARNLTVYEAITLGSIIEKEVSGVDDKKLVAGVFYNRLSQGISLGADATYLYASAVFGGEPFPDLDSPYNTRKYPGLPPGPISNVSKTSIEAVAYPTESEYLFYVTGDDGKNYFAVTDAEHEQNVAKYCTIACAPGYIPDSY